MLRFHGGGLRLIYCGSFLTRVSGKPMRFVVKYFSEIIVKSRPVRIQFSSRLTDNLRARIKRIDANANIEKFWDRVVIDSSLPNADIGLMLEILNSTPGVGQYLYVDSFPLVSIDDVCEQALRLFKDRIDGKTFVVRIKRSGSHSFNSTELERKVGGYLLAHANAKGVQLREPDVTVKLEVRDDIVFAVREQYYGLGGFPLGTQGPVLSLISGGFDSTVASFDVMRRGMSAHYIFFNLGGHAHEVGVQEVAYYLWNRYGSTSRVKFVSVPFMGVVAQMLEQVPAAYRGVVLKRMMMRAASTVAEKLNIHALVTGEAIGQVASQTIQNLALIDAVAETVVLRPLIASDKQDIVATAQKIGTAAFAESIPEYCGIISTKPVTAGKKDRVAEAEASFDFAVLDKAIEDTRIVDISELHSIDKTAPEVEVLAVPLYGSTVIDIRHPDEVELRPLTLQTNTVLSIPFFKLHKEAEQLDKSQSYMLYCEKGVMSKLHAAHLKAEGFETVTVLSVAEKFNTATTS